MSSANLIEVITKYDLYSNARKNKSMVDVVDVMRKKIKLDLVSTELSNPASAQRMSAGQLSALAFTLRFTYGNSLQTQQVTNELVSRFLDEDLKQRREQAKSTADFLEAQIKALEATMQEQENKVAEFRALHPDNRPEALQFNQQMAATTFQNIQTLQSQLATMDKTRGDLRTQLASVDPYSRVVADGQMLTTPAIQLKALQAKYTTISSQYGPDHPDVVKLRHQIEALQNDLGQSEDTANIKSQLTDARTNLAAAKGTLGPNHPDVIALRKEVSDLEGRLASSAHDSSSHSAIKKDADNPAYLMLTSQLSAADEQYKSLSSQLTNLQSQYARYQTNVAQTPMVEQEYASLNRDYENAQLRYRELKVKKMSADMNEQMEVNRKSERLVVIEPPELPTDTYPKRLVLLAAGLAISCVSGLAAVFIAENLSRSVHGSRHLTELVGVPPLITIPYIFTPAEVVQKRRRRIQIGAWGIGLVVVSILIVDLFVIPMDVLLTQLARIFGLS